MRLFNISSLVFLASLGTTVSLAQTRVQGSGPLPTAEELLREHNVPLDRSSLLNALRSPDGEVRALAALKLADDKSLDTVPQISDALKDEQSPKVQIGLALALAQLGESSGIAFLKSLCDDKTQPAIIRLAAAQNVLGLPNETCLGAVLEVIHDAHEHEHLGDAIGVLSSFQETFKRDPQKILDPIEAALTNSSSWVRISAVMALGNLGAVSAIPRLELAVAAERDEGVRAQIELDLRILNRKAKAKTP